MQEPCSDILLLERLKEDDPDAFDYLFNKYRHLLLTVALMILQNEEEAKDVVQEFFIDWWQQKLYNHISVVSASSLKNFLKVSVKNRSLNRLKSNDTRRRNYESYLVPDTFAAPENIPENKELKLQLQEAIGKLTKQQTVIFEKSYLEQKKRKEIAEELHIAESTVKTQMTRALQTLRKFLKNAEDL